MGYTDESNALRKQKKIRYFNGLLCSQFIDLTIMKVLSQHFWLAPFLQIIITLSIIVQLTTE